MANGKTKSRIKQDKELVRVMSSKAIKRVKTNPLAPSCDEWKKALEVAFKTAEDGVGLTVRELMEILGMGDDAVRNRLRVLIKERRVIPVPYGKQVKSISGIMQPVTSYILVNKKRKKK